MARLKFYFSYDGTYYNGWQRQANTTNTIQEVFERKLSILAGNKKITLMASGRTDAGVHARIQVAHADVPDSTAKLLTMPPGAPGDVLVDQNRLQQSLNSLLPPDIRVLRIDAVEGDFHALRDAKLKTYVYFIDPNPLQWPELRDYAWHLKFPLDWKAMHQAARAFRGTHDFKAFCAADTTAKSTIRTVKEARWGTVVWKGMAGPVPLRVFRVTGTGFLKHMVRSMVGTLVHIGNGKADAGLVERALDKKERILAGPTAPARGLWLWDIQYLTQGL